MNIAACLLLLTRVRYPDGEVTQQMLKYADFPGSSNGTGLFQTLVGLKIRDLYEQMVRAARLRASCQLAAYDPLRAQTGNMVAA